MSIQTHRALTLPYPKREWRGTRNKTVGILLPKIMRNKLWDFEDLGERYQHVFSRILLFFNPHLCLEKYFLPTYLLLFFLSVSSQFETVFFFLKHTHPRFSSRCSKSYQENNFESSIVFTLVRNPPGSLLFFFILLAPYLKRSTFLKLRRRHSRRYHLAPFSDFHPSEVAFVSFF